MKEFEKYLASTEKKICRKCNNKIGKLGKIFKCKLIKAKIRYFVIINDMGLGMGRPYNNK